MKQNTLSFSVLATILLTGVVLAGLSIEAEAAKKPKEIVVVGSKVKEVVREAGLRSDSLQSCTVEYDDGGRVVRIILANNGGVVKISDIPSDVNRVDMSCIYQSGMLVQENDIELNPQGTTVVHIEPASEAHELSHVIQQIHLLPVDEEGNTILGVHCYATDSSGNPIVGPSGEEIWTDKHGRVKVQFHWDVESENLFVIISCFSRDLSGTQSFDTSSKGGGYNEFVMDDTSGNEPIATPKTNNNMILKGKKILQNVIVGIDECKIITRTAEGDPDRPIIVGSIPNSGVVKLFNISLDKTLADVQCKFVGEDDYSEVINVELKKKGTTVLIVSDPGIGIVVSG